MSLSLITLLVVAAICLLLGGIVGVLLSSFGSQEDEDPEASGAEAPPGGRKGGYAMLARLWREKNSGALLVEVDGKAFLGPDPLTAEQREQVAQAAGEFARWAGVSMPGAQAPSQAAAPPGGVPASGPLTSVQPPLVGAYSSAPPVPPTVPPLVPAVKSEPKSMVEQINVVLGEMIAGTTYEAHGLTLTEDPFRGVIVWVGSACYEGIDGVPDQHIQALIRSAVAEWERREDQVLRRRI